MSKLTVLEKNYITHFNMDKKWSLNKIQSVSLPNNRGLTSQEAKKIYDFLNKNKVSNFELKGKNYILVKDKKKMGKQIKKITE